MELGKGAKHQNVKIYSEWGWGKNVKNVGFKCQIHCADLNWASLVTKVTWRLQKQINDVIIPSGEGFIFFFFCIYWFDFSTFDIIVRLLQ